MTLRLSDVGDADAVTALLNESYPALLAPDYSDDLLARALPLMCQANPALLASGTFYLVEDGASGLIGCGGWTAARPGSGEVTPDEGHIRHFATHPSTLRRGVASLIMRRCLDDARREGIRKLSCYSTRTAESFYQAHGFRTVGDFDIAFTAEISFPGKLMECRLD